MEGFMYVLLVELGFAEVRGWKGILDRKKNVLSQVQEVEKQRPIGEIGNRFDAQEIACVEEVIGW